MSNLMCSRGIKAEMLGLYLALLCIALPLAQSMVDINIATAHNIHTNMDRHMSPCTNFWGYACGNWSSNYVDNFALAEDAYAQAMIPVLNSDHKRHMAPLLLQQMSEYFNACVNNQQQDLQLPQELFSGDFEWTRATARLRKYGLNGVFFDESSDVAYNDSLRYVVQLKMPTADSNYLPLALHEQELQQLETELRTLSKKYRSEEPLLQSWSLGELKQQIPQIEWKIYFKELLEKDFNDAELRIEVSDVEYLRDVGALLQRSNKTSLELYLRAQLTNLMKKASPSSATAGRAANCIHHMRALLPLGMNYIYDRYVYRTRAEDTQQLQEIFGNLRAMFGKYLDGNRLQLTAEQLDYVRAKLKGMQLKLGNLAEPGTPEDFFDNHYASASFVATDFQHNLWQALRLRTRLQHAPLHQSGAALDLQRYYVNDDLFSARNAPYFEHERNTLTVPLIFLHWPLHDHRLHMIFRDSLLGFILAHELSHAFEQEGILFDAAGNESPVGLNIRQLPGFQAALQCVQQTPTASVKERLADVNGLQLAYDAFFGQAHDSRWLEYRPYSFEQEFRAPQLFHLNFAQFFCGRLPTAIGHDMDDVRVKEAVKNLHQFSIDFKCNVESQSIGCEMWRPVHQIDYNNVLPSSRLS